MIVPIELGGLAGTLGGIAEMTRAVFGDGGAHRGWPAREPAAVGGRARLRR